MPVEFRYARPDEYGRISGFLNDHWAAGHIYTRNQKLFDWTFGRTSHWGEGGYSFALAEDRGELVGVLGGIPFTFNCLGRSSCGTWIVNYVVREDYRRGPTALQLLSSFRRPPFETVIAFGFKPATVVLYKVLRAQVLPVIPRYFFITSAGSKPWADTIGLLHPDWETDRIRSLVQSFAAPALPEGSPAHSASLPEDWDKSSWPLIASETVGPARDADYLSWRYCQHPCFDYRLIAVRDGARTGLLVWRLETIRQANSPDVPQGERIGRIVEFLPASRTNAGALMQLFLQKLTEAGGSAADYYGFHGPSRMWLDELGFRAVGTHTDGPALPSRFQPLDGRSGDILGAMFVPSGTPPCSDDSSCAWYWTKSDSDQDRPN